MSRVFDTRKGRHIWPTRSICEVHREIYDLLVCKLKDKDLYNELLPLLEEAYVDGIKMTKKLVENKCSLPQWEKNVPTDEAKRLRELRIHLTDELQRCRQIKLCIVYNPKDNKLSPASYSKNYLDMFTALTKRFDKTYSCTKSMSAKDIEADVIIFFDPHSSHMIKIDGIENHKALKYEYLNDPHQTDLQGKYDNGPYFIKLGAEKRMTRAKNRGIQYVICPCREGYQEYLYKYNGQMEHLWFPVAPAIPDFEIKPLSKRYPKILGNGHLWKGRGNFKPYEFRRWAYSQPEVTFIPHYGNNKKVPIRNEYMKMLANFAGGLALCDEYVVAKYLEIPLCGCVCFAQYHKEYKEMGFTDGVNCVVVTRENFRDWMGEFKKDPSFYQEMADMGRETALNWTADKFADYIYSHAKERL